MVHPKTNEVHFKYNFYIFPAPKPVNGGKGGQDLQVKPSQGRVNINLNIIFFKVKLQ